jgi:peptide/nickel transport system substrate-binding protein
MEKLGYGPDKPLAVKVATRNFPGWRDYAVVMISHFKEIYIDGELDLVDTALWYPKMARKDYTVGAVPMESGVDDPDQMYYENYVCNAARNYTGYCNTAVDRMVEEQSAISDVEKRKQVVWAIEKKLAEDDARPILFYYRVANCHYPKVKGLVTQVNSIYNGQRFEDLWLAN